MNVVVIGYGMVGSRFVDELCAINSPTAPTLTITVLGAEDTDPYNRVLLSEVVAGQYDVTAVGLPTITDPASLSTPEPAPPPSTAPCVPSLTPLEPPTPMTSLSLPPERMHASPTSPGSSGHPTRPHRPNDTRPAHRSSPVFMSCVPSTMPATSLPRHSTPPTQLFLAAVSWESKPQQHSPTVD